MKKYIKFLTLTFCGIFMGCGGTPECSSKDVTDLVKQIVSDELKKNIGNKASLLNISLDAIRTQNHDKKVDKYSCAAELILTNKNDKNLQEKRDITYEVETTDDKKNIYVSVYGL
jgi:hypothetical protein